MLKKATSLAILLLVFITLTLAGLSLFSFYNNTSNVNSKIIDSRFLEVLNAKENLMNYYINEILDNMELSVRDSSALAIDFNNRAKVYGNSFQEFSNLQRINAMNFAIEGDRIIFDIDFNIEVRSSDGRISAVRNYKNRFERKIS